MSKVHGTHYLSPKLTVLPVVGSRLRGIFAITDIRADEVLAVWGGRIVTNVKLKSIQPLLQEHAVQVEEGLFLAPINQVEPANYFNHSCNPNAGLRGQIALVAMRPITSGEQVCYDYAMNNANPIEEFACICGELNCRRQITGDDWKLSTLWLRYSGYFSPYIRRKINIFIKERRLNFAGV